MANIKTQQLSLKVKVNQFISENGTLISIMADITFLMRSIPLDSLSSFVASSKNVMNNIKWLMLAHSLILQTSNRTQEIHQFLDQICLDQNLFTPMDQILIQKFITPYKSYLYKRNFLHVNVQTPESQIYPLMNIIRKGVSFIDIVFTIGRYLSKMHPFLVDFNVLIAKDTAHLYNTLKKKITQEIAIQNADFLQDMNERLYMVFYNCYFNKFVSKLAPNWINTEHLFVKRESKSKKTLKQNLKYKKRQVNNAFCQEEKDDGIHNCSLQISDDEPFKSASTIASKNDQNEIDRSRREFITLAEEIVHIIESKQSLQHSKASFCVFN